MIAMQPLPYDCHTHTTFSDGHNSPEENVRAAQACGLRCVALTDHVLPETPRQELADRVTAIQKVAQTSNIAVLPGAEGAILDTEGSVSVTGQDAQMVKLVLAGIGARTRSVGQDPPASMRRYADNILAALQNAASNPAVDIIAHPFGLGRLPAVITPGQFATGSLRQIARSMYDSNVAFEIDNQVYGWYPQMPIDEFTDEYTRVLRVFSQEGVKFVVGSNAHSAGAVGNLRYCRHLMREAAIELSQLVDLERLAAVRQQT